MKSLAIRLDDDVHAQLSVLAQLEDLTVTDAIRQAIATFIESKCQNPELTARAEAVLADIDRDAASRRDAIASLFEAKALPGQPETGETNTSARSGRSRGNRSAES
jgi:predicted transcriptional regulator